jgi:vacuolar-type H+-ATPase subunit E/Vma4
MQPLGSIAAVAAAVREDAAAEAERIAREAVGARDRIRDAPLPGVPSGERAARLAAARREARERLAAEDALDARAALDARESWMTAVRERAREIGEPAEQRRARLARLVREAAARLPAGPRVIRVAAEDLSLVEDAIDDPDMTPGGVRVESGRLAVDESVEARTRRLEPIWRAALGRIWG